MSEARVNLLLTEAGKGLAMGLQARIGEGARGERVEWVELPGATASTLNAARRGVEAAYQCLSREKYIDRQIIVEFASEAAFNRVAGRSAELAFALALTAAILPSNHLPPIAATGQLNENGGIEAVDQIMVKLDAALTKLRPGGVFVYPGSCEADITKASRDQAAVCGVRLLPGFRLEMVLQQLGVAISHTWLAQPFRGLEPFEFEHASIFYGRDTDINALLGLLLRQVERRRHAILVTGPSGRGKSSLVLAGLIPALLRRGLPGQGEQRYCFAVLRPRGVTPTLDPASEADMLCRAFFASWCHGGDGALSSAIPPPVTLDVGTALAWLQSAAPPGTCFLLVLDQLEEWFESHLQPDTIERALNFFAALAERGVWLVGTLTNHALAAFGKTKALAACIGVEGQYALGETHGAALWEAVIKAPAQAAGLIYEAGLDAELLTAASHGGVDILPLLELLLTELYDRSDPIRRVLRFADYHAAGGLDGVIGARAERAFFSCDSNTQAMLGPLLWQIETAGDVALQDYPPHQPMHELINALRRQRLLVIDQDEAGNSLARVAHQALLQHWPRASQWREAAARDIALWRDLMREAGQRKRGERALIQAGPQLTAAVALRARRQADWIRRDAPVIDYIQASSSKLQRRRRLLQFFIAATIALLTGAGAYAGYDYITGLYVTHIKFDDIAIESPDHEIPASSTLVAYGLTLLSLTPDNTDLWIKDSEAQYHGEQVAATSGLHFLTQEGGGTVAPISFTPAVAGNVRAIRLQRAALWSATSSGVTHPAWTATAYDAAGIKIAQVHEDLISSCVARNDCKHNIPARWLTLRPDNNKLIAKLVISSDYRDANDKPFAGSKGVLLTDIDLQH